MSQTKQLQMSPHSCESTGHLSVLKCALARFQLLMGVLLDAGIRIAGFVLLLLFPGEVVRVPGPVAWEPVRHAGRGSSGDPRCSAPGTTAVSPSAKPPDLLGQAEH